MTACLLDVSSKKHPNTFAIVDPDVYEWASRHKWGVAAGKYVGRYDCSGEKKRYVLLHRAVLGGDFEAVDHINGNPLDCRRVNLRPANARLNGRNRGIRCNQQNRFKGVRFRRGMWLANFRDRQVGKFESDIEAALAYDREQRRHYWQYARLNFPCAFLCAPEAVRIYGR